MNKETIKSLTFYLGLVLCAIATVVYVKAGHRPNGTPIISEPNSPPPLEKQLPFPVNPQWIEAYGDDMDVKTVYGLRILSAVVKKQNDKIKELAARVRVLEDPNSPAPESK